MKAHLKKLSRLLSISLSLAVILTVLPMNTIHVHAATSYVDFLPSDIGTTNRVNPVTVTKDGVSLTINVLGKAGNNNYAYENSGELYYYNGGLSSVTDYNITFSASSSSYTITGLTITNNGSFTSNNSSSWPNLIKFTGQGPWTQKAMSAFLRYVSKDFQTKAIRVYYHTCSNNELASQNGTPATCTADGWNNYYKCSVCGKIYAAKNVSGTAYNDLDAWKASTAGKIEKLGHSWSTSWTSDGTDHWHVCTRENCTATDTKVAHSIGESGTAATCSKQAVCGTCGASFGNLGNHNLVFTTGKAATCDANGWKDYYQCSVCSKVFASNVQTGTSYTLHEWQTGVGKLDATNHVWAYSVGTGTETNKITATCSGTDPSHSIHMTVNATDKVYSGSAYTGASISDWSDTTYGLTAPTIKYVGRGNTPYTESTTAPTNVGTYTAKITVDTATATVDFEITPKEVELNWHNTTVTYNGTAQTPTASVINKANDTDEVTVNVTFADEHKNAGTYTATASSLSGTAADNYKLPATLPTKEFKIEPKAIGLTTITSTYNNTNSPEFVNESTPFTQTITIEDYGAQLGAGDYNVTGTTSATLPGLYTVTITGIGNYTGTTNIEWKIKPKQFTVGTFDTEGDIKAYSYSGTYDGQEHSINVTIPNDATISYYAPDLDENSSSVDLTDIPAEKYSPDNPQFKDAGSYTVYYKVTKTGHADYENSSTVIISHKEVDVDWSNLVFTYDNSTKTPTATVKETSKALSTDVVNVTVTGGEINTGTYTARAHELTGADAHNYKLPITKPSTSFTINKAKVDIPTADPQASSTGFTYNGSEQTYTLATSELYTISNNTRTNAGTQTVTVELNDKGNYEWKDVNGTDDDKVADREYTFTIKPLDISNTANISIVGNTYFKFNGNEHSVNISGITHSTKTGLLVKGDDADGKDYTIHGNKGLTIDKYTLTIKFNNNYEGTVEIPWDIVESIHSSTPVELDPEKVINPDSEVKITIVGDEDLHHVKLEEPVDLLDEDDYKLLKDGDTTKYPGTTVKIEIILSLDMNDEESINPDSLAAIKEISNDHAGHHFYDLTLRKVIKYVKSDGTVVHMDVVPIVESPNQVTITLDIPDTIDPLRSGYSRKYSIIRSHKNTEGIYKAEMMDSSVNDNKVSFTTNKFSDYALTYKDTLIPRSYKAPDTSVR